jgi:hypothetical protein
MRILDPYAHAQTSIDERHRVTHDGMMFHSTGRKADVSTPAGTFELLLNVPAEVFPHIQKIIWSLEGAPCDLQIYEGATTSSDGTAAAVFNNNRNSSNTPGCTLTHTPTVTGDGTLIHDLYVGTTGKDIGQVRDTAGEEWVFKPSTKYLFRLTNNSGAVLDLSWEFQWYELSYTEA